MEQGRNLTVHHNREREQEPQPAIPLSMVNGSGYLLHPAHAGTQTVESLVVNYPRSAFTNISCFIPRCVCVCTIFLVSQRGITSGNSFTYRVKLILKQKNFIVLSWHGVEKKIRCQLSCK